MNAKTVISLGCVFAAAVCMAEMEYATPESQGVDSQAILNWIDACEKTFDGVKEGRMLVRQYNAVRAPSSDPISAGSARPVLEFKDVSALKKYGLK